MMAANDEFVGWFRAAAPYIHVHRGRTFVVQINDELAGSDGLVNLLHDLALLTSLGIKLILIYGMRQAIDVRLQSAQQRPVFHRGKRLTSAVGMGYVKEVAGRLLIDIQAKLSSGPGNTPMLHAGLQVATGNYITAKPVGIIDGVDYEFTGEVRKIDTEAIRSHLHHHEIVVIPPVGYSITGEAYNLAAAELAADVAVAMRADKVIYLVAADVLAPLLKQERHDNLTRPAAARLLTALPEESTAGRYLCLSIAACDAGIDRTHLLDQAEDGAIVRELFSKDGTGVMLTATSYDELHPASGEDIAGILALIRPLEQQGHLVERSREKLELEIENFSVLSRDGVIIGCVALYVYGEYAELACLAVAPEYQKDGRGEQLLTTVAAQARVQQAKQLFVLTTQAEHWFLAHGFVEHSIDDLPVKQQAMYNYQRNSRVLVRPL